MEDDEKKLEGKSPKLGNSIKRGRKAMSETGERKKQMKGKRTS